MSCLTLYVVLGNFFHSIFWDTNFSPAVSNLPFNPPTEFLILTIIWLILEIRLLFFKSVWLLLKTSSSFLLFPNFSYTYLHLFNVSLYSLCLIVLIPRHFASLYLLALASSALLPLFLTPSSFSLEHYP